MPKLSPLPIRTRGKGFFGRLWTWVTEVRAWEVVEDWEYELPNESKIIIPKSFIFDGASIPRPLWGILSPTGLLLIPGLIHDFGYRFDYLWALDSEGCVYKDHENAGQEYWDKLFYDVGEKVNGMKVINVLAWVALALMGRLAWKSNRKRYEADILPNKPLCTESA
ncbi:MAG: DUF1353 domain-containing protein [Chloroflexi bacterium]|nr:DUF1353 domain-containing protein [Chloroflexota bacterium]